VIKNKQTKQGTKQKTRNPGSSWVGDC